MTRGWISKLNQEEKNKMYVETRDLIQNMFGSSPNLAMWLNGLLPEDQRFDFSFLNDKSPKESLKE